MKVDFTPVVAVREAKGTENQELELLNMVACSKAHYLEAM